ncbi:MAG: type II secretion system protein GspD [Fusobacteria bacterium]|nr:type II secretion system protein GspD [Fusobacteriota bacterium]
MKKRLILLLVFIVSSLIFSQGYNGEKVAIDKKISVDFRDMELLDVIRIISREYNLNIIAGSNINGKITVSFRDVDVDEALENILFVNGYTYLKKENIIRIESIDELKKEGNKQESIKREEIYFTYDLKNIDALSVKEKLSIILSEDDKIIAEEKNNRIILYIDNTQKHLVEQLITDLDKDKSKENLKTGYKTEVIKIKYLDSENIEKIIEDLNLNFNLLIKVSKELNSFIVHGDEEEVKIFKNIVKEFDIHPLQVTIEAKIIEIGDEFGKETGVNWQYLGESSKGNNFDINVGNKDVAKGSLDGLDIRLGLLSLDNFQLFFNALMEDNNSNLLSNPTITTISGKKAHINIGEKFRYRINTKTSSSNDDDDSNDENIVEIETGIILEVIPVIFEDGKIIMEIMQSVEEVTGYTSDNLPQTSARKTDTNVIIDDGNTLVIGGLIKENNILSKKSVPILGKIPLIGKLFQSEINTRKKTNLVIFITPKIIKTRDFFHDIVLDENKKISYNIDDSNEKNMIYKSKINLESKKELIKMYLKTGKNDEAIKEIEYLEKIDMVDNDIRTYKKKAMGGK